MWTKTNWSRRDMLRRSFNGIGGLAMTALGAEKQPNFPPKVKNVIFLFMSGGVSQVDTFEHKPALEKIAGQRLPPISGLAGELQSFLKQNQSHTPLPSPYPFREAGRSGRKISTLFEHLNGIVDDLAFVHGVKVDSNNHSPATMHVNTGSILQGSPSVGAWATYGLGSVNQNLPGYIVLHDPRGGPVNGSAVWQSGYLPAAYQGTPFRPSGVPILDLDSPPGVTRAVARRELDLLHWLDDKHAAARVATDDLESRIAAYELAFRMQTEAPAVVDIAKEPESIRKMYGLDKPYFRAIRQAVFDGAAVSGKGRSLCAADTRLGKRHL